MQDSTALKTKNSNMIKKGILRILLLTSKNVNHENKKLKTTDPPAGWSSGIANLQPPSPLAALQSASLTWGHRG